MLKPYRNLRLLSLRTSLCVFLAVFASLPCLTVAKTNQSNPEKWYEIEIIVFSQPIEDNFEAEIWNEKPGYPKIQDVIELYSPTEALLENYIENVPTYLVEPERSTENYKESLEQYARKIKNSPKYHLLIHRTWRQQTVANKVYLIDTPDTSPIDIDNVIPSDDEFEPEKSAEDLLMEALLAEEAGTEKNNFSKPLSRAFEEHPIFISAGDSIIPFDEIRGLPEPQYTALSYEGPPRHLIYGFFKLSISRYLHMDLDLLYRGEPYEPAIKELSIEETFPMAKNIEANSLETNNIETNNLETNSLVTNSIESQNSATVAQTTQNAMEEEGPTDLTDLLNTDKAPLVGVRMNESKRIRLQKIYYLDHPLFGVIARVNRYTPPPPEEEEEKKEKEGTQNN